MLAAYQGPHFMIGIHSIGLQEVVAKRAGPEHDIQYVFDQPQLEWSERSPTGFGANFQAVATNQGANLTPMSLNQFCA